MLREVLYAKIHRATVTDCNPNYMGSITIDPILLEATGMVVNEKVLVADCDNGQRFETYIFLGERGSGEIRVNGAAANRTGIGHQVLIMSFCQVDEKELATHRPRVVICDKRNGIADFIRYPAAVIEAPQIENAAN
ncbi:MAG TPA: aspartate 1-decarboxylase [Phycisphaerales bacterium]|nr:aspartate 1-decarboxylase [Phycisphaerales bacterium]HRQ75876.1 aspartate 1-decarboxylase [Phycisphaerales bacterium]